VRAALEDAWRRPVPDALWTYLEERGYVREVEDGAATIEYLLEEARQVIAAGQRVIPQVADSEIAREVAGAAASARIDALSATFAAWAHHDLEVQWFRDRVLPGGLLGWDEAGPWILEQRAAAVPDGVNPDGYLQAAFARSRPGAPRPFATLWYAAGGQERAVSVDSEMFLGDLTRLGDKLSSRYRWRPSGAVMFVLTGEAPEVYVYTGSASISGGAFAATSTVTMTLDPALAPEQVAGIYARLRAQVHPGPLPRPLSVKHYRLAQHTGPRVSFGLHHLSEITGPGRRPRPGPDGLIRTITPVTGWTWTSLRQAWNDQYATNGGTWRYDTSPNFIRDAKHALVRLLAPGWRWQAGTTQASR
jgi:hypothetical protein